MGVFSDPLWQFGRVDDHRQALFDKHCRAHERTRLGDAAGPTQYGVNLLRLPPNAWLSQRHWHAKEDKFIYVLSGDSLQYARGYGLRYA